MTKNINSISLAVIILWVLLPVTNLWSESTLSEFNAASYLATIQYEGWYFPSGM